MKIMLTVYQNFIYPGWVFLTFVSLRGMIQDALLALSI